MLACVKFPSPHTPVRSTVGRAAIMLVAGGAWLGAEPAGAARGVSPYLPLDIAPEIERQIERIMILAGEPVMTRPLAAATVLEATEAACDRDPVACAEVQRYLQGFMKNYGLAYASLEIATTDDDSVALPVRHGMRSDSHHEAAAQVFWQPSDNFLLSAGFVASGTRSAPTGSVVSFGNEYLQVDAGYRDRWLSPATTSAMLLSTQAETMPSIGISNYRPLTKFGVRYDFFVSEMSYSDRISFENGFTAGEPTLAGMHLSIEPFPGWSVGVNRIMQFGGGARPDGFGDLIDAFFRPNEFDNSTTNDEFGNQAASVTARYVHDGERPFAVYFEYAGEDTSTNSNARLGNVGFVTGVQLPSLHPRLDLNFEVAEWQNGWYVSGIYQDGLVNDGNVIGHWGADWRAVGDGVGARSVMASANWVLGAGGTLEGTYFWLDNEDYTGFDYERAEMLKLRYSRRFGELIGGVGVEIGSDSFGTQFSRFAVFMRY